MSYLFKNQVFKSFKVTLCNRLHFLPFVYNNIFIFIEIDTQKGVWGYTVTGYTFALNILKIKLLNVKKGLHF